MFIYCFLSETVLNALYLLSHLVLRITVKWVFLDEFKDEEMEAFWGALCHKTSIRTKIWNQAILHPYHLPVPVSSSQRHSEKSSDSKDMKYEEASMTAGKSVNWYNLSKSILTFSVKNLTIYPTEIEHILTYIQGQWKHVK